MQFRCCGVNGVNDWVMFNANFSLVIDLYPTSCCTNTTDSNCGKIQGVNRNVFTEVRTLCEFDVIIV